MPEKPKIKRLTSRILMGTFALIFAISAISSFNIDISGKAILWFLPIIIIGGGSALVSEGFRKEFLNKSTYRKLDGQEIIGLLSILVGGITILSGITMIPLAVFAGLPIGMVAFLANIGGIVSILAAFLAFIQIFVV